jgi:DNA-binding transcriptional LysR family regulator
VELFIREKSRLRLSPAGWNFLEYTRRILDLVHEARLTVAVKTRRAPSPWARWKVPRRCASRRCWRPTTTLPKVDLDLSTGPSGTMLEGVLSGRLVAAFVDGPVLHPTLEGMPVFEEEMVVIAPLHHARSPAPRT